MFERLQEFLLKPANKAVAGALQVVLTDFGSVVPINRKNTTASIVLTMTNMELCHEMYVFISHYRKRSPLYHPGDPGASAIATIGGWKVMFRPEKPLKKRSFTFYY